MACLSIGCGRGEPEYENAISELHESIAAEVNNPGGVALTLGIRVREILRRHPHEGISPYFHLTTVEQAGTHISAPEITEFNHEGLACTERMPTVARSWDEFLSVAEAADADPAGAVAE
jgi:hypothetical protein